MNNKAAIYYGSIIQQRNDVAQKKPMYSLHVSTPYGQRIII